MVHAPCSILQVQNDICIGHPSQATHELNAQVVSVSKKISKSLSTILPAVALNSSAPVPAGAAQLPPSAVPGIHRAGRKGPMRASMLNSVFESFSPKGGVLPMKDGSWYDSHVLAFSVVWQHGVLAPEPASITSLPDVEGLSSPTTHGCCNNEEADGRLFESMRNVDLTSRRGNSPRQSGQVKTPRRILA